MYMSVTLQECDVLVLLSHICACIDFGARSNAHAYSLVRFVDFSSTIHFVFRALFNEDDKSQVPVMLNMYNHGRLQAREPDYDTIPDVLAHVQLERMEMVRPHKHDSYCNIQI